MKRTTSGAFDRLRPLTGQPFLTCLNVPCEIAGQMLQLSAGVGPLALPLATKSLLLHTPAQSGCGNSPFSPNAVIRATHPPSIRQGETPSGRNPTFYCYEWGEARGCEPVVPGNLKKF